MAEKPVRIAISGYYGCGNTGDEAVLAGIVESFEKRAGVVAAEFTVLSADPADTERRHGVAAVDRMSVGAVRGALRSSDLLISGGGSLLQDTTSVRSLLYYLWVVRMGLKAGVPVMFYAQGIGPLRRPISRFLTRLVANKVSHITVRDSGSANLLKRIGVTRPPIEVTADPAFALTACSAERIEEIRQSAGVRDGGPAIGIALRPWHAAHDGPDAQSLAEMADRIVDSRGGQIVFIPMQPPGDVDIAADVYGLMRRQDAALIVVEPLSPRETLGLIGSLDGLVAMRLHALIFAAASGVPLAALSYDPKVTHLMRGLGQEAYGIGLATFTPRFAADCAVRSFQRTPEERAGLRSQAEDMARKALINVDRALRIAREKRVVEPRV